MPFHLKTSLRDATLAMGLYGPLRKTRRLFSRNEKDEFRRSVDLYRPFISAGDLCFDIGSNIGERAEVFLALGAKVVAFEPLPHCAREIGPRSSNHPNLTVVQSAVGAEIGTADMVVAKWSKVSSLAKDWVRDQDVQDVIQVRVTTLDDAISSYGIPNFCKIDVEGFELEVLKGLSQPIRTMTLEYDTSEAGTRKTLDCLEKLRGFGPLEINVTSGEAPYLLWSRWLPDAEVRAAFPISDPKSNFGDIFIRFLPSALA